MWDPYAEFQSATLPNGLTVHATHWPGRPWEVVGFLIHSGAEQDPVGLEGLAHFVEHLVSGNLTVSQNEMRAIFEDWGGSAKLGTTGFPFTGYRFFVPAEKEKVAQALSMFGEMLLSAKLEKSIERERQVIVDEFLRSYPAKFAYDLQMRKQKALHSGSWLERFVSPLGNPKTVARITQADLQAYYDKHYTPANMSVVGVGGMELRQLVALLSDSPFGINKPGMRTPLPTPVETVSPPTENRYVFEVSQHASLTTPLEVGAYRSYAKLPGTVKPQSVKLLADMLDEKLNDEVRERRAWAYDIDTRIHDFRHFWEFSIQCDGLALKALDEVENVVEAVIASINDCEDLLARAKRHALASNHMIDPTGKNICDGALEDLADDQRIMSLEEGAAKTEQITMGDIREVLRWLRPAQRYTVITRP